MAAASYYDANNTQQERFQLPPSRGPQFTGMHPEGSNPGLSEELRQGVEEPQQRPKEQYLQQNSHAKNSGVYDGRQQQMGSSNYAQGGGPQQMNAAGEQAAVPDNRDTMTKWLDRIEKKFGGERFNNPENAEKNRKLNENILKRLKQVGMLVVQRAPRMLMNMAR